MAGRWQIPDAMGAYVTHELAEALGKLTAQQRAAIARIVSHHYIDNKPMRTLFEGEDKICGEALYYRRGTVDPKTGDVRGAGWSHQPAFADALDMAVRLALQQRIGEETQAVREAVRRARLAAAPVVGKLAQIALGIGQTKTVEADGTITISGAVIENRDRISAGKHLLDIALKNTEFGERETDGDLADDWWKAAKG